MIGLTKGLRGVRINPECCKLPPVCHFGRFASQVMSALNRSALGSFSFFMLFDNLILWQISGWYESVSIHLIFSD